MFRPLTLSHRQPPRRGTSFILIVVIMVAMFAAVGTAYVLYAMQQARTALYEKDAAGGGGFAPLLTAPDPTSTVNIFFGSLIYDVGYGPGTTAGSASDLNNALRGHSLARSMYGFDYTAFNSGPSPSTPWNGVGIFHEDSSTYGVTGLAGDRATFVNFTQGQINGQTVLFDPEYMGVRPVTGGAPNAFTPGNYVGKNAGYSYPDLKDFFLATVDPVTGQVLVPSFYRPWMFGAQGLAPTNPNWTNATGRLLTLRPRTAEHPQFPQVPPNADGSYTGDVQNLTGGVGVQMNDSLWMNIGLPLITLPGGQKVQPLVAPLIVPLNGLLNASVHGNAYFGGAHSSYAGYGPWEVSLNYVLGSDAPNIINGFNGLPGRGTPQQRSGIGNRAYAPYLTPQGAAATVMLPSYSPVSWNNVAVASPPAYPTGNLMTGLPTFAAAFLNTNAPLGNHPSLFNPTEWPTTAGLSGSTSPNGTFPLGDIKRFQMPYAGSPYWYQQSKLAPLSPTALTPSAAFSVAIGQNTTNSYRADPTHANRMVFTGRGYDIVRPKLVPNFPNPGTTNPAQLTLNGTMNGPAGSTQPLLSPKISYPSVTQYPSPGTWAANSDFASSTRWSNALAALGSVDLNRPLADYRPPTGTGAPLSGGNLAGGTPSRADMDRRKLAHDIFVRLAAATGAAGITITQPLVGVEYPTYQYTISATPAANPNQYDALRYLAQLAVNIVDYIDNDDISTVFVWNPVTPNGPNYATDPATDANNFATAPIASSPAGQIGLSVVFGHEKTRLVINEAYSEITNDPATMLPIPDGMGGNQALPAGANAHVRFWLELLNPTAPPLTPATGPLGNGQVSLSAYQIEIRRETRITGNNADTNTTPGQNQAQYLFNTNSNTTGGFNQNQGAADIVFNLASYQATNTAPPVAPNNGNFNPAGAPGSGMVLLGPVNNSQNSNEFHPDPSQVPWSNGYLVSGGANNPGPAPGSNSMAYTVTMPQASVLSSPEFRRHIVLLRRLANPYLGAGPTNPYITVDMMDYVPSFDAVSVSGAGAAGGTGPLRVSRPAQNPANDGTEYDPLTPGGAFPGNPASRFSVGKVQPYAGHAYAYVNPNIGNQVAGQIAFGQYNQYSFGGSNLNGNSSYTQASMVIPQAYINNNNNVNGQGKGGNASTMNTFGWHNSSQAQTQPGATTFTAGNPTANPVTYPSLSDTIMLPFDWLPQMDRPLVNELELLSVRDTPPHRVTDQFLLGSNASGPGVTYHAGAAPWLSDGYTRALEFLTVKSYVMGVPHGGRVPGKINVNATQDQRVIFGLFDAQPGNGFDNPNFVSPIAWSQWMNSRRVGGMTASTLANGSTLPTAGMPGESIFDGNVAGLDRPFLPFGAPIAAAPATPGPFASLAYGYATGATNTIDQTIMRRSAPGAHPFLYAVPAAKGTNPPTYPASLPIGTTYTQVEPARKIMNNVTTVNHQYVVFLTIGYFNVVGTTTVAQGTTIPQLGAEAYLTIPGDMRQKFVAVVDMSNMGLAPTGAAIPGIANPTSAAGWYPYFTSVEQTAYSTNATTGTLTIAGFANGAGQLCVGADGVAVPINSGDNLVLGYGAEQQFVTVLSATPPAGAGQLGTITVQTTNTQPLRTVWAGTCVSNIVPGYPGPQPNFDYTSPKYTPVLPYIDRLK